MKLLKEIKLIQLNRFQVLTAKPNARPVYMAMIVKMCAAVITIHRVTRNRENVFATKDGEVKTVPNHVKKATMAWVRNIFLQPLFIQLYVLMSK